MRNETQDSSRDHWKALWRNSAQAGTALVFSVFWALLSLTLPLFMMLVYDRVLNARSSETLTALIVLAIFLIIAMNVLDYARRRILARFAGSLQQDLESSFHALPPRSTTLRLKSSSALSALDNFRGFMHSKQLIHVIDLLWLPLFVGSVFLINSKLGWLSIIGLICLGGVFFLGQFLSANQVEIAKDTSNKTAQAKETISRISRWQGGNHFGSAAERWMLRFRAESRVASIRAADLTTMFESAVSCIRVCFSIAVLSTGAILVLKNELTVGGMVASVVLLNRVFAPFVSFLNSTPNLRRAIGNWNEIGKKLNSFQENTASEKPLNNKAPLLELRKVSIAGLVKEHNLLKDVSFKVWPGEVVQITGEAGCGKTLLCEAMTWSKRPKSGTLLASGSRLSQLDFDQKSNLFGYVPELPIFFGNSIAANISGLESNVVMPDIRSAAAFSGLDDLILELPNGYDTIIDELGKPLSRTQLEQLSLARAVYHDPKLIIVDEPSDILIDLIQSDKNDKFKDFLSTGAIVMTSKRPLKMSLKIREFKIRENRVEENKIIAPLQVLPMKKRNK